MKQELRVTLQYILLGSLWIFISDELVYLFMSKNNIETMTYYQNLKGCFYILITSVFLYFMLKNHNSSIRKKIWVVIFILNYPKTNYIFLL